jgi:hypothetical protein
VIDNLAVLGFEVNAVASCALMQQIREHYRSSSSNNSYRYLEQRISVKFVAKFGNGTNEVL